jgi:hypothetical protein
MSPRFFKHVEDKTLNINLEKAYVAGLFVCFPGFTTIVVVFSQPGSRL